QTSSRLHGRPRRANVAWPQSRKRTGRIKMRPQSKVSNHTKRALGIAARAGRWSARHRKRAIVGWIAFVLIAINASGNVTTKHLSTTETVNGQSAAASRTLDR